MTNPKSTRGAKKSPKKAAAKPAKPDVLGAKQRKQTRYEQAEGPHPDKHGGSGAGRQQGGSGPGRERG